MRVFIFSLAFCLLLPVSVLAEEVSDPVVEDPVVEDPVVEDPVVEDPVGEDPVGEDPVGEDPVVEDPAVDDPVVEYPVSEDSLDEGSVTSGLTEADVLDLLEEMEDDEVSTLYTVSTIDEYDIEPLSDAEQQTMRDVIALVFGEYVPRTQTVTEYLSDGSSVSYTEVVPGVAGLQWEWISGAGLFALALFSFFKIVGVLLKNG